MKKERMNRLEKEIVERLEEALKRGTSRSGDKIKNALCELGRKKGYGVYGHGTGRYQYHEFLWDLVWADTREDDDVKKETGDEVVVKRLPMIAEIEMGTTKRHWLPDFEKLKFGVTGLRLFVCGVKNSDEKSVREAHEFCRKLSQMSKKTKSRYLLVMVPRNRDAIEYRFWVH